MSDSKRDWIDAGVKSRLDSAKSDIRSLADYEIHLYTKVQFLLDATLGFINTKQNDIFTVLTIASVVGIPPTLVASIYGMNFKNMPELGLGMGLSIWTWIDFVEYNRPYYLVEMARMVLRLRPGSQSGALFAKKAPPKRG